MHMLNRARLLIVLMVVLMACAQLVYGQGNQETYLHMPSNKNFRLTNRIKASNAKSKTIEDTLSDTREKDEIYCLALNIYFEARGESKKGQRAVGHVVINRVKNFKFPNSICKVVKQGSQQHLNRCQFSWWCDGRSDKPKNVASWRKSMLIAKEIIMGNSTDPTGGALWYHAHYVSPYWKKSFLPVREIGRHIFYKDTVRVSHAVRESSKPGKPIM